MSADFKKELGEVLCGRSDFYRLLSSLFFKEVSEDFLEKLEAQCPSVDEDETLFAEGWKDLRRYFRLKGPDPRTELAVDYARTFLAAGRYEGSAACPFESIYTSEEHLVMQDARDEVRAVYVSNGVNVSESLHLPEDHLSFELEFVAILSDRARDCLEKDDEKALLSNLEAQTDFLQGHVLNWIPNLEESVKAVAREAFYPAVMKILRGYVEEDVVFLREVQDILEA